MPCIQGNRHDAGTHFDVNLRVTVCMYAWQVSETVAKQIRTEKFPSSTHSLVNHADTGHQVVTCMPIPASLLLFPPFRFAKEPLCCKSPELIVSADDSAHQSGR